MENELVITGQDVNHYFYAKKTHDIALITIITKGKYNTITCYGYENDKIVIEYENDSGKDFKLFIINPVWSIFAVEGCKSCITIALINH